jgi:hypothetical protein
MAAAQLESMQELPSSMPLMSSMPPLLPLESARAVPIDSPLRDRASSVLESSALDRLSGSMTRATWLAPAFASKTLRPSQMQMQMQTWTRSQLATRAASDRA